MSEDDHFAVSRAMTLTTLSSDRLLKTLPSLNLPLSSSSPTSRELLSQILTCSG